MREREGVRERERSVKREGVRECVCVVGKKIPDHIFVVKTRAVNRSERQIIWGEVREKR